MKYRPEVDGLRAIAVVPVIFFHAGFAVFSAGFVGVDIFFVISGYLITQIISNEIETEKFSVLKFYERRLRRIAPALLFVCAFSLPFAVAWMLPSELDSFGESLLHSMLMISNFFFWREADYFAEAAELKPLLHTWTLAVEEQFYIVFPVVLLLLRRLEKWLIFAVVASMTMLSFAATQIVPSIDTAANFYLLPTRFWELGAGALLALLPINSVVTGPQGRSLLAWIGLVMLTMSVFYVPQRASYPGIWTLLPVFGTVLVLAFASAENSAGKLLGSRMLVAVGLLSYSLYLWHQPVFAFARIRNFGHLSFDQYLWLLLLTLCLAVLTFYLVEQPFRNRKSIGWKGLVVTTFTAGALLIGGGAFLDRADGLPERVSNAWIRELSIGLGKTCNGKILPECATSAEPELAVWGDSFAAHLVDGIIASAPNNQASVIQLTMTTCGPFFDIAPNIKEASWPEGCLEHNANVIQLLESTPSIRYVVVSSPFAVYLSSPELLTRHNGLVPSSYETVRSEFLKTLSWIRSNGMMPVVFAPPPRSGKDTGLCNERAHLFGASSDFCSMPTAEVKAFSPLVDKLMSDVAKSFPVVTVEDYLCDADACRAAEEDVPVYRDDGHFSRKGSEVLGTKLQWYTAVTSAAEHGCGEDSVAGTCRLSVSLHAKSAP